MKKVFLSIVAIAALVVLPMSVSAQTTETTSATDLEANVVASGHARIVVPLTLTEAATLEFGELFSTSGVGTISIGNASDSKTSTTGITGGTVTVVNPLNTHPAKFTLAGQALANYTITCASSLTLNNQDNTGSLTVTLTNSGTAGALDGTGAADFYVGGSFPVTAATAVGDYTGTYNVSVIYN